MPCRAPCGCAAFSSDGGACPERNMSETGKSAHSPNKLGKKLYVVFTEPIEAAGDRMAARAQHLEYQYKLEREGIMFAAGPILDGNDQPSGSCIIIYRAPSLEAATEIANSGTCPRLPAVA